MSRFEQVALDYRTWKGASSDELGYAVKKGVYENHTHGPEGMKLDRYRVPVGPAGQKINVYMADARKTNGEGELAGPTVLKFQSHNYRIDELSERKTQIHAHHMGARVLDIELPGVTMNYQAPNTTDGGFMTPRQFIQSFSGDFDGLSSLQLDAAQEVAQLQDGDEVHLYGESLGSYSAVALARALAMGKTNVNLKVTDMTLVEPVNAAGNRSIAAQLRLATEDLAKTEHWRRLAYLSENTDIGHPVTMFEMLNDATASADRSIKARVGQALAAAASGAGLRKGLEGALFGALANDSDDGPQLHRANITLIRGRESSVTKEADMLQLQEFARDQGVHLRLVEFGSPDGPYVPAGHSQLDSLGRMAHAALFMAHAK